MRDWLKMFAGLVERGSRSPTTLDQYEYECERLILPALGDLRLGELSTPLLDRFIQGVLDDKGAWTAKVCRTVLSGCVAGWSDRAGSVTTRFATLPGSKWLRRSQREL